MARQTLEQKAAEANKRFGETYRETLQDFGYYMHNFVSMVGVQEYGNGRILPEAEGKKPCIVACLSPLMDTAMRRLEDIRQFTIKPEFEGFKVYVEGSDGIKEDDRLKL